MFAAGKLRTASADKHRRGPSTSRYKPFLCDRYARRFAQDDGFVEGLKTFDWCAKNPGRSKKSQAKRRGICSSTDVSWKCFQLLRRAIIG
jgi:hypothetical protein